jgi:hypothetical protein
MTTVTNDPTGRAHVNGLGTGAIIFGPGPGIGYPGDNPPNLTTVFGSPVDPFIIQDLLVMGNLGSVVETEAFSFGETDVFPSRCSLIIGCIQTLNSVVYPVATIEYTDGTVDQVNFEWSVPEPTSLSLVTIAIGIFALSRRTCNCRRHTN